MSRKEIAQLLGKVFIQRSAVNLLSTVLDTPEFFWSAPDSMQSIYKKVCEYMELDDRVEVLNNRYQVGHQLSCAASALHARLEKLCDGFWEIVSVLLIGRARCCGCHLN